MFCFYLGCPPDTIQYRDRCFWISSDELEPDDAQLQCEAAGGTLAKTTDDEIYTFLHALFIRLVEYTLYLKNNCRLNVIKYMRL